MDTVTRIPAASLRERKRSYEDNKVVKRLRRLAGQAISDFGLIENGDRVMVCLSGGKDSYALLDILLDLRQHAPIEFDIVAVNLDQQHPGFPAHVLPEYLERIGVPYRIERQDTYGVVKRVIPEGKTMCSLCSRLRRGVLYRVARELNATKIALGHHRDDILETFLLNLFYTGQLKAMPPKLRSDDGRNVVIRPLAYCEERDLAEYARIRAFPIIPCNLCGSQENMKRAEMKRLLRDWEKHHPGRVETMLNSLKHVRASHLLDRGAFDFQALPPSRSGDANSPRAMAGCADTTIEAVGVAGTAFAED